jgi:cytidylate kinase
MLAAVDEAKSNWLLEIFGKWLDRRQLTQIEYVVQAGHTLLLAARHSNHVFLGRGAQFILPREKGLVVNIIAPLELRIKRIMERRKLEHGAASKAVRELDHGRHDFIKTYFHQDAANPELYDLVINTQHLGFSGAVDLIVDASRRMFGDKASVYKKSPPQ